MLRDCSSLNTLCLAHNCIEAAWAQSLARELGGCSSLTALDLQRNYIDDDGISTLTA